MLLLFVLVVRAHDVLLPVLAAAEPTMVVSTASIPTVGGSMTLTVNASTGATYQWRYRGAPIADGTNSTFVVNNLSRSQGGSYDVLVTRAGVATAAHALTIDVRPQSSPDLYVADPSFAPRLEQVGAGTIRAALPLADGKFLVGGDFTRLGNTPVSYLARLNADGSVDSTFHPPQLTGMVHALLRGNDGRIYMGGDFSFVDGSRSGGLVRLTAALVVDPAFVVGQGFDMAVHALGLQPDGRIFAAGEFTRYGAALVNRVVRLNLDGTLDTGFRYPGNLDTVRVLQVQNDGKVVIGGGRFASQSLSPAGFVYRLISTGEPDTEWVSGPGSTGRPDGPVLALWRQPDGAWLVGGNFTGAQAYSAQRLMRMTPAGAHDPTLAFDSILRASAVSVDFIADGGGGRILVAGDNLPLSRLEASGSRDATFPALPFTGGRLTTSNPEAGGALRIWGTFVDTVTLAGSTLLAGNGTTFTPVAGETPRATATVFDAQLVSGGRMLIRGSFTHVNDLPRTGLARLNTNGSVDPSFNAGAAVPLQDHGPVVLQGDGRLLLHNGTALIRLASDGSADSSFAAAAYLPSGLGLDHEGRILVSNAAPGGIFGSARGMRRLQPNGGVDVDFSPSTSGTIVDIVMQSSGRIVVGGSYSMVNSTSTNGPVRLFPDGSSDPAYQAASYAGYRLTAGLADDLYVRGTNPEFLALRRLLPSGAHEISILPASGPIATGGAAAFCLLPDGRLLRASPPHPDFLTAPSYLFGRHLASGEVDASFQSAGIDRVRSRVQRILLLDDASLWLFGDIRSINGSPSWDIIRLMPATGLAITTQPVLARANVGGTATFSVETSGSGPLSYQWYRDGVGIPGAVGRTYSISGVTLADAAQYHVRIVGPFGEAVSANTTIAGFNPSPAIVQQPLSIIVNAGSPAVLSVAATATGPLKYQWRHAGKSIPDATGATFMLPHASRSDVGFYDVIVADGLSWTLSDGVNIDVAPRSYPNHVTVDESFAPLFEVEGGSINNIVEAPDGKFIVSGDFRRIGGVERPGLARIDRDFQVDLTFAPAAVFGHINPYAFPDTRSAKVHAVLPDGKILVTRALPYSVAQPFRTVLHRLTSDGAIDASFNAGAEPANIYRVVMLPDGRMLAVNQIVSDLYPPGQRVIYRLNANGSLDAGYAPIFRSASGVTTPTIIAVQPDGRVIFGGGSISTVNGVSVPGVVRLTETGGIDSTFALTGVTGPIMALCALPDGRLLAGGNFNMVGASPRVGRLSANGAWEAAFLHWPEVNNDVNQIRIGPNGKIWAASSGGSFLHYMLTVWRLSAAGELERKFATSIAAPNGAFVPLADDQVLATSSELRSLSTGREDGNDVVRFGADGVRVASAGLITTAGTRNVIAAPGGKIYVTGDFTQVNGVARSQVVRLNADGSLDPAFSVGTGFNVPPTHLLLLPDNQLMVSGSFSTYRENKVGSVVRLGPDGAWDSSFKTPSSMPSRLQLMRDGRVLAGETRPLLPDGSLDLRYDGQPPGFSFNLSVPRNDGGVVVAAPVSSATSAHRLTRYSPWGAVVGVGSTFSYTTLTSFERAPMGGFVSAGSMLNSQLSYDPTVRWLMPELFLGMTGVLPVPFVTNLYRFTGPVLLPQEDGRVIVADYFGVKRLAYGGAVDSNFSAAGINVVYGDREVRSPYALRMLDDGSILVADQNFEVDGLRRRGLLRLVDAAAPRILTHPPDIAAVTASTVTLTAVVGGPGPLTLQWFKNGTAIAGATDSTLTLSNVADADAGAYLMRAVNSSNVVLSNTAWLSVHAVSPGLLASLAQANVTTQNLSGAFTIEGSVGKRMLIRAVGPALTGTRTLADPRLSIVAAAGENVVAENDDWSLATNAADVAAIAAEIGASPLAAGSKDAAVLVTLPPGTYRANVLAPTAATGTAGLEIYDADTAPRLVYLATRATVGGPGGLTQVVALRAPVAGRNYLVRVLGPSTGLQTGHPDPQLAVFSGATPLATNDDWGGGPALTALALSVGAMPIPAGSKDAALSFVPVTAGAYTLQVGGADAATGTVVLEIFEMDTHRAGVVPLAVVSPPDNLFSMAGRTAMFGVVAVGKPAPTFQWSRNGSPISGAVSSTFVIPSAQVGDAGTYSVRVSNGGASTYTASATLAVAGANNATHGIVGRGYVAGSIVTLTTTLHFVGAPAALTWNVELPAGWSFASDTSTANQKPAAGATGTLAWAWTTPPASPLTFTYTLNVPAGETLTRSFTPAFLVGGVAALVVPAPLTVGPKPPLHSADTDGDYALSLFELTRVIELYNTRNGTVRTGAYRVDVTNLEDGFGADSTRVTAPASALIQYHSADTRGATTGSPRDGMIDLFELTRVIELYNTRAGTVRTGRYHVQADTEDGFAAGP